MTTSKSLSKMPTKMFTKLSVLTRVLLALIALGLAFLIIKFGMVTYEAFSVSEPSSKSKSKSNSKTIVKLYSMNGCGHCKKFAPVWEELNTTYPSGTELPDGSVLELIKYSTDNAEDLKQINKDDILGFPTITITYPNAPAAVPYEDSRTVNALWNAITKKSS